MAVFNLDQWWDKNVDPNLSVLDRMYKQITRDAIDAAIGTYGLRAKIEEQMENDSIDLDTIDLSDVL